VTFKRCKSPRLGETKRLWLSELSGGGGARGHHLKGKKHTETTWGKIIVSPDVVLHEKGGDTPREKSSIAKMRI